jgi:hypothetical protein
MAARLAVAERHAAATDVDGQRLRRAREAFLGDHAATGLALLVVVAARTRGTDALDGP